MSKKTKSKPLIFKIIEIIIIIVFVVALAAVGAGIFLCVRNDVDPIGLVLQVKSLNSEVDESAIADNKFTHTDCESAGSKKDALSESTVLAGFTDREIAAYVDENLKVTDIAGITGAELIQIKFYGIPTTQPSDKLSDMEVIIKLELNDLNSENKSFSLDLMKKVVPNEIYVVSRVRLDRDGNSYSVTHNGLSLNCLSEKDSENLFKAIGNIFGGKSYEEFNIAVGEAFAEAILSDEGFYGVLKESGAEGYGFESVGEDNFINFYFIGVDEEKTITYHNVKGADNPNPERYTVLYNTIVLEDLELNGYEFDGWFSSEDGTEKITEISVSLFTDYDLYAKWTPIVYSITLELNGGTISGDDIIEYTIESDDFTLPVPEKTVGGVSCPFIGWLYGDEIQSSVTIEKGTYGNFTYKAVYDGDVKEITLNVDGIIVGTVEKDIGDEFYEEDIPSLSSLGLNGYSVEKWYKDETSSEEYTFGTAIFDDATIFGTATYIVDDLLFYPYREDFANAQTTGNLTVKSRAMLTAYMDYVNFYEITKQVNINLSYSGYSSVNSEINDAYQEYKNLRRFNAKSLTYNLGASGLSGKFYVVSSGEDNSAKFVIDVERDYVYDQQDYALKLTAPETRADDYDDFKIDKVAKTVEVRTSEQLVWVLENGYRPEVEAGSAAESVYNAAKSVLRSICSDDYTDVMKLRAIYEWLIMNVQYDNLALEMSNDGLSADEARTYDSWYAEGVFFNKKAVCEGYAKALLIMAKIENIPAVFVTGNDHAWNRVLIDDTWYGVDATHGNVGVPADNAEILSYTSFLFTDEEKEYRGYATADYSEFKAETVYDFYSTVDLEVSSIDELADVLSAVKNYTPTFTCDYYTFEIYLSAENAGSFNSWLTSARTRSGFTGSVKYFNHEYKDGGVAYTISVEV